VDTTNRRRAGRGVRLIAATIVVGTCVVAFLVPAPVGAIAATCGQEITRSVKLRSDVGPCASNGLVIRSDDIVLDLDGHRVFGSTSSGDGAGIVFDHARRSTVKNGSVTGFDAGVVIDKGGDNVVRRIRAFANVGDGSHLGDGIVIIGSNGNRVRRNEVFGNGPYSGISVFAPRSDPADPTSARLPAVGNRIVANAVHDNRLPTDPEEVDDAGIRLETATSDTSVKRNRVSHNGLDGIVVFAGSTGNVIASNTLAGNGHHDRAHRLGDGIRVFGTGQPAANRLEENRLMRNAGYGIAVAEGGIGNVIRLNEATGNGSAGFSGPSPTCVSNTWKRNSGRSFEPSCTKGTR
jgi:parallel beta-helix repeat protein